MRSWKEERRRRIHIFWWWLLNLHTLECLFYARMCCTPRIMISTTKQKWWEVKKEKENGVDNVYALLHCQFGVFPFSSWPLPSQASAFLPLYNPKSSYNLEIQINHYSFKNHNHLRSSLVHHILTHSVVLDIKKGKIKTQNLNPANTRAFFYWLPLHCWNTFFYYKENIKFGFGLMWSFNFKIRSENGPRLFWEWCHYALFLTFQLFENPLTEIQQKRCNFSFLHLLLARITILSWSFFIFLLFTLPLYLYYFAAASI